MSKIPKSYQKFLQLIVKLSIVFGALYFIYQKVYLNGKLNPAILLQEIKNVITLKTITILIGFSIANWFFEILKWKTLVSTIKMCTLKDASLQSLTAHTAALITPNRIGEYGIKAWYFKTENRKKILLLNLIHHMLQMLATILFGGIGIAFTITNYKINLPEIRVQRLVYYIVLLLVFLITGRIVVKKRTRYFYWNKIISFIKNIPFKTIVLAFLYSVIKYLIFTHQFIYLLRTFNVEIPYYTALYLLFTMYFISSILPNLPIFDWAIKGSIAIIIFNLVGVNEITILIITTIMWFLNFALPALIGSYFILKFDKTKAIFTKN